MRNGADEIEAIMSNLGSIVTRELQAAKDSLSETVIRLEGLQRTGVMTQHQSISVRDALAQLRPALNKVRITLEAQPPAMIEGPKIETPSEVVSIGSKKGRAAA